MKTKRDIVIQLLSPKHHSRNAFPYECSKTKRINSNTSFKRLRRHLIKHHSQFSCLFDFSFVISLPFVWDRPYTAVKHHWPSVKWCFHQPSTRKRLKTVNLAFVFGKQCCSCCPNGLSGPWKWALHGLFGNFWPVLFYSNETILAFYFATKNIVLRQVTIIPTVSRGKWRSAAKYGFSVKHV